MKKIKLFDEYLKENKNSTLDESVLSAISSL